MKVVSFNVNSIRVRLHQLQSVIETYQPDVIGLQETKVPDDEFPVEEIADMGYDAAYTGQKTHYGVALLTKREMTEVVTGYPDDTPESQRRFVSGVYDYNGTPVRLLNGYFPQGENRKHETKFPAKEKYYADLQKFLKQSCNPAEHTILMGDMNVAPLDLDIGIGDANMKRWLKDGKTSFLPEEREWLQAIANWGLQDTFRILHPDVDDRFSWFDYRSRGFERDPKRGLRIDLIMASAGLSAKLKSAEISYDIRAMDKPSDHCPIFAEFSI
jgi:exodeoxyribonuclease-3